MTAVLIVAGLAIMAGLAVLFRKGGKDAVRAAAAEKSLQETELANAVRDRLKSDPDFAQRVRDRFTR